MKRFFLIMVLIFSLSIFNGCNMNDTLVLSDKDFIMLSLDLSSNGRIVQSLDFSVNSKRLNSFESENEEVIFLSNLSQNISELRAEFLLTYTVKYIQNPVEEYKLNQGLIITNVSYNETTDTIGFNLIYTSVGAWNYYHNTVSSDSNNESANNGNSLGYSNIFLTKNQSQGTFPFSSKVKISEQESIYVGDRYIQKYLQASEGLSFENQLTEDYSPLLIYNYSTYYARLHTDADYKFSDSNGHNHHLWTIECDKLSAENKISISSYTVHTGYWYLFAIIFALIFAVIIYVSIEHKKIFKNLKKKPSKKEFEKINKNNNIKK